MSGLEATAGISDVELRTTHKHGVEPSLSKDQRQLAVMDQNPGNGKDYRFALFMEDSRHHVVAVCDPRIVNN